MDDADKHWLLKFGYDLRDDQEVVVDCEVLFFGEEMLDDLDFVERPLLNYLSPFQIYCRHNIIRAVAVFIPTAPALISM